MTVEVAGPATEPSIIKIYGASDDLIEVEGDLSEEFNVLSEIEDGEVYIGISDGTLIRVTYDGYWNLRVVRKGTAESKVNKANADDGNDDEYSDVVTVIGFIDWVVCAKEGVYAG